MIRFPPRAEPVWRQAHAFLLEAKKYFRLEREEPEYAEEYREIAIQALAMAHQSRAQAQAIQIRHRAGSGGGETAPAQGNPAANQFGG